MPQKTLSMNTEDLLPETRRLREQVLSFKRIAKVVVGPLGRTISHAECEAMVTARANIHGTLENLLNQDLGDLLRQLLELEGHLRGDSPASQESEP
jgi:hypothetical protein